MGHRWRGTCWVGKEMKLGDWTCAVCKKTAGIWTFDPGRVLLADEKRGRLRSITEDGIWCLNCFPEQSTLEQP